MSDAPPPSMQCPFCVGQTLQPVPEGVKKDEHSVFVHMVEMFSRIGGPYRLATYPRRCGNCGFVAYFDRQW